MKKLIPFFSLLMAAGLTAVNAQVSPRPNFVIVIGDDIVQDSYGPTGGPSWFDCNSIDRIADEGVNFSNYFCVYSLCIPSRSSILTGLYPHNTGAVNNSSKYYSFLPTIGTILHSAGYHTAMVGKYHVYSEPLPEWDYWLAKAGEVDYIDSKFNYNGVKKKIPGNITDVITDSSHKVLLTIDTPFIVLVEHLAAHRPVVPQTQYEDLYKNEDMPVPDNFVKYTNNYPSFLYERATWSGLDELNDGLILYFEAMKGIDANLEDIFNILGQRQILDNTMLIFTGDNGYMFGEHCLSAKGFAYDPSIKLPLFIRYPKWFTAGTEVSSSLAIETDIAPTILEAAGINSSPYNFEGISLHKFYTGETQRKVMMYENIKLAKDSGDQEAIVPSIRCVRDFGYKYIHYSCNQQTEEFFDLVNDPEENNNLMGNPAYTTLIQTYRDRLDSLRIVLNDTLSSDTSKKDCFMVFAPRPIDPTHFTKVVPLSFDLKTASDQFSDDNSFDPTDQLHIYLYNSAGQLIAVHSEKNISMSNIDISLEGSNLPAGIYILQIMNGANVYTRKLFKS